MSDEEEARIRLLADLFERQLREQSQAAKMLVERSQIEPVTPMTPPLPEPLFRVKVDKK
jgi:hypothetical protein